MISKINPAYMCGFQHTSHAQYVTIGYHYYQYASIMRDVISFIAIRINKYLELHSHNIHIIIIEQ